MAVTITIEQVKDGFETSLPDTQIQLYIDVVAERSDACLDANSVPDSIQTFLKVAAVRHFGVVNANSGRGLVQSESAPNGASRSFAINTGDYQTPYLAEIMQFDQYGCVSSIFENEKRISLRAVGGRPRV